MSKFISVKTLQFSIKWKWNSYTCKFTTVSGFPHAGTRHSVPHSRLHASSPIFAEISIAYTPARENISHILPNFSWANTTQRYCHPIAFIEWKYAFSFIYAAIISQHSRTSTQKNVVFPLSADVRYGGHQNFYAISLRKSAKIGKTIPYL